MKIKHGFLLLLATSFLVPALVYADVAPDPIVGTLGLAKESNITLVREKVIFKIPKDSSLQDEDGNGLDTETVPGSATFWLKNDTNKKQTLQAIFPTYMYEGGASSEWQYARNVTVKMSGKTIPTKLKDGSYVVVDADGKLTQEATTGHIFGLTIPKKKTVTLTVNFDAPVSRMRGSSNDFLSIRYLIASGAGWNGKIGKAEFQIVYPFTLKDQWTSLSLVNYSPKSGRNQVNIDGKTSGKTATWVIKDFEPLKDGEVDLNFVPSSEAKETPESNTKEEW